MRGTVVALWVWTFALRNVSSFEKKWNVKRKSEMQFFHYVFIVREISY